MTTSSSTSTRAAQVLVAVVAVAMCGFAGAAFVGGTVSLQQFAGISSLIAGFLSLWLVPSKSAENTPLASGFILLGFAQFLPDGALVWSFIALAFGCLTLVVVRRFLRR